MEQLTARRPAVEQALVAMAAALLVMWAVETLDVVALNHSLDGDGIRPRSLHGLLGIVVAPFLHASFAHLTANTIAFVPLSILTILGQARDYVAVLAIGLVTSGVVAWLISPAHVVVIGASGVVFALLGFLLFRGWFTRNPVQIGSSVVAAVLFYGALRGLLPTSLPISWEDHVGGFLGGIGAARLLPSEPRAGRPPALRA